MRGIGSMDDQNRNLILAMVLSSLVLIIWMVLFAPPPTTETGELAGAETTEVTNVPAPTQDVADGSPEETVAATPEAERIEISTPSLSGSVSLAGGRIDQLSLMNYAETVEPGAEEVTLLSPVGTDRPY